MVLASISNEHFFFYKPPRELWAPIRILTPLNTLQVCALTSFCFKSNAFTNEPKNMKNILLSKQLLTVYQNQKLWLLYLLLVLLLTYSDIYIFSIVPGQRSDQVPTSFTVNIMANKKTLHSILTTCLVIANIINSLRELTEATKCQLGSNRQSIF